MMADTPFWQDRPTLVTGATGLVGTWVVRRLLELEANVVCLLRDWVPESELVQADLISNVNLVRGDLLDQAVLERVLGEYEVDTVIHLAAQTVVGVANRNPISTFESNITGTWRLLEACRRSPLVRQIVLASSDKAYGAQAALPYTEATALEGRHPYDVSKACADLIAQSYAATFGTPVVITRCGNFFGGGDLNWSRLVPGTIRSVLRGQPPVIRSDGRSLRDYFYVEDGAAAYLLLAERLASDPALRGQAFNFSYQTPVSVVDMVEKVLRMMGSRLTPEIRNDAPNEIGEQFLDAQKAREALRWRPAFTLDQGLRRTIDWYKAAFETEQAA
ncbi:MAG: NAD-dependent epimerase/dehydratase family protein [Candidatus Dormibacter sp.]